MSNGDTQLVGNGLAKMIATNKVALGTTANKYGYRCDGGRLYIVFKFDGETDLTIKHNANSTGERYMSLYSFSSTKALKDIVSTDWGEKEQVPFTSLVSPEGWEGGAASTVTTADYKKWNYSKKGCLNVVWENLPAGYYVLYGTGSEAYIYGFEANVTPSAPAATYSVTYILNGGGGTEPTQEDVAEGATFTLAAEPTAPAGQEFAGWSDGTNTYNAGDTYTMGAAPVTFTAQWQAETPKYDVTYDLNGGTGTEPTQPSVSEGATVTLAEAPTWEGYRFDGWLAKDENGNDVTVADGKFTMPAAKVAITAQWVKVWTVTFNTNGGSAIASVVVDDNGALTEPTAPTKDCYAFGEWQKDGVPFDFTTAITSDITLTATWAPKYASTLDFAAVTMAGTTGANPIGTFLASGNMVASNLGGDSGWETSKSKSGYVGYKLKNTSAVVKFLVKAGKEVEITLGSVGAAAKLNKGGVESEIAKKSGDNEQTVIPAFVAESDMLITITTNASSNSTVTLKKISIVDPAPQYTVTYALNGATGTTPTEVSHKEGEKFNLHDGATGITAPTNKTFINWKDQDDNEFAGGAEYTMPGKNVTLTAQWAGDVYTVKFMDGETELGTKLFEVSTNPSDADIDKTKALNTFAAWQKEGEDIALDNAFWATLAKDAIVTLTARWTKVYAQDADLEGLVESEGTSADWQAYMSGKGYAYSTSGVSLDAKAGGKDYNNWPYQGLKAKEIGAYVEGRIAADKLVIIKLGHMAAAANVSLDGVAAGTATGLDADEPAGQLNYFYVENESVLRYETTNGGACVLKAITITNPYEVTFNAHGGDDIAAVQGKPSITLPEPTNGTMNFKGWYDAETGGNLIGVAGASYTPTGNITLHAQWEAQSTINTLSDLKVNGETVLGFAANEHTYRMVLPYKGALPMITSATPTNANATFALWPVDGPEWTDDYDGGCYRQQVVVTPQDPTAEKGYYDIRITYAPKDGVSIIKVATTGGTNKTVTGLYAGEGDVNLSSSKKMDSEKYIGFTLDGTTLQAGDRINVHTTDASTTGGSHIIFYDNMTDKTELYDTEEIGGVGNNIFTINAAMVGQASAYVYRSNADNAHKWNGYIDYIEVTRPMNPVLTAITFDGVPGVIDEAHKKVTVELPFSSDVASLEVEPTIAWNAPATTNSIVVNDGNWVVGDNTYVLTDKDGDQTTYTITLTKAAASADATLKDLKVNGNALTLVDGVYEYDYELPYGTTAAPVVEAEANDANATVSPSVSLTKAVITVTAENGAIQEYVINFTVSRAISYVIYDGSVQESIETSGTGLINWSLTNPSETKGEKAEVTCNDKYYTKCVKVFSSATKETDRYMTIEIPTDYIAKFYLAGATNSKGNERSLFISKEITGTLDQSIAYSTSSTYEGAAMMSDYQMPGTYYLCCNASIRLYELSVVLYPIDYKRDVRQGYYGTICLPNGGIMTGATLYEVAYYGATSKKIFFDEILNGTMKAGVPYIFLPNEGADKLAVFYTDEANESAKNANGLYGFIGVSATDEYQIPSGVGNYIIQNNQYREVLAGAKAFIVSNRAYIKLSEIPGYNNPLYVAPAPAPGRKRIAMGTTGAQVATGVDQVQGDEAPTKMIINGQLFILRGEKMYDAQGKLVK